MFEVLLHWPLFDPGPTNMLACMAILTVIGLLHHKQSLGFSDEHIILIHEVLCLINVNNSHMQNSKAWGIGPVMTG
jgi:hypothetical protein